MKKSYQQSKKHVPVFFDLEPCRPAPLRTHLLDDHLTIDEDTPYPFRALNRILMSLSALTVGLDKR